MINKHKYITNVYEEHLKKLREIEGLEPIDFKLLEDPNLAVRVKDDQPTARAILDEYYKCEAEIEERLALRREYISQDDAAPPGPLPGPTDKELQYLASLIDAILGKLGRPGIRGYFKGEFIIYSLIKAVKNNAWEDKYPETHPGRPTLPGGQAAVPAGILLRPGMPGVWTMLGLLTSEEPSVAVGSSEKLCTYVKERKAFNDKIVELLRRALTRAEERNSLASFLPALHIAEDEFRARMTNIKLAERALLKRTT